MMESSAGSHSSVGFSLRKSFFSRGFQRKSFFLWGYEHERQSVFSMASLTRKSFFCSAHGICMEYPETHILDVDCVFVTSAGHNVRL